MPPATSGRSRIGGWGRDESRLHHDRFYFRLPAEIGSSPSAPLLLSGRFGLWPDPLTIDTFPVRRTSRRLWKIGPFSHFDHRTPGRFRPSIFEDVGSAKLTPPNALF